MSGGCHTRCTELLAPAREQISTRRPTRCGHPLGLRRGFRGYNSRVSKKTEFETKTAKLSGRLVRIRKPWQLRKARREFEIHYVAFVLELADGNREKAAKMLGISMSSLKTKLHRDYTKS